MGMVQEVAGQVLARAGVSAREPLPHGALDVALELYGGDVFVLSRRAQVDACTATVSGATRIVLRSGMHPRRTHFAVARMLARLELRALGVWTEASERAVAGFLVAPAAALGAFIRRHGVSLDKVSRRFVVTETCAALRLVELGVWRGAVVTPATVYRPRAAFPWVPDDTVRALAVSDRARHLRRFPIADEPGRVALLAA